MIEVKNVEFAIWAVIMVNICFSLIEYILICLLQSLFLILISSLWLIIDMFEVDYR